jgi:hypothetical protein
MLEVHPLQSRFVLLDPNLSISAIGVVIGTSTLTIVHHFVEIVAFIRTATTVVVQTSILLQVPLGFLVPFLLPSSITSRLIKDQDSTHRLLSLSYTYRLNFRWLLSPS